MKITDQRNGRLNEQDRLQLGQLLIKAGYMVRIGKERKDGKTTNEIFIEYIGDKRQSVEGTE